MPKSKLSRRHTAPGKEGTSFWINLQKSYFQGGIVIQDPTKVATIEMEDGGFNKTRLAKRLLKLRAKLVTKEKYNQIMRLLDSPDEENQNLGVQLVKTLKNEKGN